MGGMQKLFQEQTGTDETEARNTAVLEQLKCFFSSIVSSTWGKEVNLDWEENIGRRDGGWGEKDKEEEDLKSK